MTSTARHAPDQIAPADWQEVPGLGVYVHIPFCATRCDYCAFSTWTDKGALIDDYVDACVVAIERACDSGEITAAETVFIGGGTPSLIGSARLARIVRAIDRAPGAEVTIECNPESTSVEFFSELRDAGVTRISLGIQSVHPHVLAGLGRNGDPEVGFAAMAAIGAAGFATFNVDLIYGGAGESDEEFANGLQSVLAFTPSPPHISAYALTIERGTPLSFDHDRHPEDDVLADHYEICDAILSHAGLGWYEVSNWAAPGHECRHNANCWQEGNYVAIGCAAHGHDNGRRYRNMATPEAYIEAVRLGRSTIAGEEHVTGLARVLEQLELALRTRHGIPERYLAPNPNLAGLVDYREGRAILTQKGRLLLNAVVLQLDVNN